MRKAIPIRTIESITYVHDYTKGDNRTGAFCGPACVAMLTGVNFDEVIALMRGASTSKQHLKKALDHYGIRYAPKSTRFDPDVPLPDICVIRMIIADENGVFKFKKENGHWGIYFKGTYYDPDFGVSDICPIQVKIFQVWEIYP